MHNMNNQNLFDLFGILYAEDISQKEKMKQAEQYAVENKVDESVILALTVATEGKIDYEKFRRKEDVDMCKLFDEIWNDGKTEGIEQQAVLSLFKVLSRKGQVSQELEKKIHEQKDMDVLNHWFDMALDCDTVEDFANRGI